MGQVWLADEIITQNNEEKFLRQVCIKIVPPEVQHSQEEMERIKNIFQQTHALHHTNICPVYALKVDQRHGFYIVMKYVNGQTLNKIRLNLLNQNNKITIDDAIKYLFPVAEALDYAHKNKIIHRDIKPDNILIDEFGIPFIIDFGLAAQIHTSLTNVSQAVTSKFGTLIYKAPEQWQGELQDAKTDQYSLAVVLYEFLSGRAPFIADNEMLLGYQVSQKIAPKIAELPDNVNLALAKALAKERKNRYENCVDLMQSIILTKKPNTININSSSNPNSNTENNENTVNVGEQIKLKINSSDYAFRWCPPGLFMMGSLRSEIGSINDDEQRPVIIHNGFWISETTITQEQWEALTNQKPSYFKGKKLPVENITWYECQDFIIRLNNELLKENNPAIENFHFALPTSMQWEYACRAGSTMPFHFGFVLNGDKANCKGTKPYGTETKGKNLKRTTNVGTYPPNNWGIYDMHGNVWEWCNDSWEGSVLQSIRIYLTNIFNSFIIWIIRFAIVGGIAGFTFGYVRLYDLLQHPQWNSLMNIVFVPVGCAIVFIAFDVGIVLIFMIVKIIIGIVVNIFTRFFSKTVPPRIVRGGSWNSAAKECRSASIKFCSPNTHNNSTGFRVVLVNE
jgi:serine/threonine protein kinase